MAASSEALFIVFLWLINDDTRGEYWFENEYLEYLRKNHLALLEGVEVDGVQPAAVAPTVLGAPAVEGTEQNSGRLLEIFGH
ncbi:unnamed protein product [Miscanthus lutarioriparius]|uniref:Uncharacterized protein n=1 Tax=Miscanthus lutarioriparius TaxID=422564 RepID=A0A811N6P3_9POAL|nr:unnamed protein product [Miscanthus lutarioriparius]